MHEPRRRCVGCGRIAPKTDLLRIAVANDETSGRAVAVADPSATLPGRGAYLCRDGSVPRPLAGCLAAATRRGAVQRTLRAPVALDPKIVESVGR